MFTSKNFTYNGERNTEYGIYIMRTDAGLIKKIYGSNGEIREDYIPYLDKRFYYGMSYFVLQFTFQFAPISGSWDNSNFMEINNWLYQKDYCEFISDDDTNVVYMCKPVGEATRYDTSYGNGYVEITFRCDGSTPYAPVDINDITITGGNTFYIFNPCNIADKPYYYPEIEFKLTGSATSFTLVNKSDSDRTFQFTSLNTGETVYVNNDSKLILSDKSSYRLSNFNRNWLRLVHGDNELTVTETCTVQIRTRIPIIV